MKSNKNIGVWIGILSLLALVLVLFSGYIVPGRDPDIGAFQLAAILVCATASLCAFDFALLWPRHSFLRKRDWIISLFLVFAGMMFFSICNIVNELHLTNQVFQTVMASISYIGILIVFSGFYWRFQNQLDGTARNIIINIKKIFEFRLLHKHLSDLLFVALGLYLLVGGVLAYRENPGVEVILNPFRLLLILISIFLAGRSILKFFLSELYTPALQMLAPLAGITLWALVLGIGVGLRIPVWQISFPLWGLTIFLAWRGFCQSELQNTLPWFGIAVLLTLLVTFPYNLNGFSVYLGSPLPDGWSYTAYGQYLWNYERGISAGLQPIYQYAAHLSHSRYLGSSLLGFLSPITGLPGDTQSASGFFYPVVLFVYSSSIIAFAIHKFSSSFLRSIFIVLSVLSGWIFTVISANNLDQAMVLAFLPGMAVLMKRPHFDRPVWIILIASMLAACTYIYTEMAVFIAFTIVILALEQVVLQKLSLKHWVLGGIGILVLGIILLSPFLPDLYPFLRAQFGISNRTNRPGGNLAEELLSTRYGFIALWGLGAGLFSTPADLLFHNIRLWLSYFLGTLLLLGSFLQFRERKFGAVAVTIFFIGIIYYYLHVQSYPYAAYKLISISWWLMTSLIVSSIKMILDTGRYFLKYFFQALVTIVVIGFATIFFIRSDLFASSIETKWVTPFRQLEKLPIPDDEPVIVSVWGWLPNQWAMYYLRERPTLVYPYRSYASQKHVIPLMEQSAPVNFRSVRAILTDRENPFSPSRQILWQNEFYILWGLPGEWAYVAEVIDPDGKTQAELPNTIRLIDDTNLVIIASRTGNFGINFDIVSDVSDSADTYVLTVITSGTEVKQTLTEEHQVIILHLLEGRNQISIRPVSQSSNPDNDPMHQPLTIGNLEIIYQP